jgi:hypothetical protein
MRVWRLLGATPAHIAKPGDQPEAISLRAGDGIVARPKSALLPIPDETQIASKGPRGSSPLGHDVGRPLSPPTKAFPFTAPSTRTSEPYWRTMTDNLTHGRSPSQDDDKDDDPPPFQSAETVDVHHPASGPTHRTPKNRAKSASSECTVPQFPTANATRCVSLINSLPRPAAWRRREPSLHITYGVFECQWDRHDPRVDHQPQVRDTQHAHDRSN